MPFRDRRSLSSRLYAREVVEDVQRYVLTCVQDSAAFGETGDGNDTRGAGVSIKR